MGWLTVSDPEALKEPPAARATGTRLLRWLDALEHLSPMTRQLALNGVLRVLRASAPELNWSDRLGPGRQIRRNSLGARSDRKLGRVLSSAVLLRAGLTLASSGAQAANTRLEEAKRQKDGTMVAVLALLPVRRRAFVGLRLGQSIHLSGDNIYISLPEELTKTGVAWETRVPAEVSMHLRRYVFETRPFLLSRGSEAHDLLWVSSRGAPYQLSYFGTAMAKITKRITGVRVSPHLFRDAAATTLARTSSASAALIAPVLAHTNLGTAERHYIQAGSIEAGRDYAAVLARIRREGK